MDELPSYLQSAVARGDYQALAGAIATGAGDPAVSRALIVFNLSREPIAGTVVFPIDMPWRPDRNLPPFCVTNFLTSGVAAHIVHGLQLESPLEQAEHGRLRCELHFECAPVAALGWDTYIVEYLDLPDSQPCVLPAPVDRSLYRVVETLRHDGSLQPVHTPSLDLMRQPDANCGRRQSIADSP